MAQRAPEPIQFSNQNGIESPRPCVPHQPRQSRSVVLRAYVGDKQREFKLGAARQFMNKKEVREAADWKLMELRLVSAGSMSRITLERFIDKWCLPETSGIEWRGCHSFRRGLASTLFELGCDDLTAQRILGHAKVTVTREHYSKLRDPKVEDAMSRLAAATGASHEAELQGTHTGTPVSTVLVSGLD